MFNHVFTMESSPLITVRLKQLACAAALGFALNTASADTLYVAVRGQVRVNGQPQEGVTVETIPCAGARLPSDWPSPPPHTISTAVDPITGINFSVDFTACCPSDNLPGPSGSFTFTFPGSGQNFTAVDVQLKFSFGNFTPVILSCDQVRAAYVASLSSPLLGVAVFDVNLFVVPLLPGDTATMGFWANKNGQALINSLNGGPSSTVLANWLASNFPYLFGANAGANNLTGKANNDVAALYMTLKDGKATKTDAQILATALATYVTDSDLAGNVAAAYGFNVSAAGTGGKPYNVGIYGSAIGLSNNTDYSVFSLLQQANLRKQSGNFDASAFNAIFSGINETGQRL